MVMAVTKCSYPEPPIDSEAVITNRWVKGIQIVVVPEHWNGGDTVDGLYYYK